MKADSPLWDHAEAAGVEVRSDQAVQLLQRADHLITGIMQRLRRLGRVNKDQEDYRHDILLALVARLRRLDDPSIERIENFDAYVAQSIFNLFRRKHRARAGDPITKSLDSDNLDDALEATYPTQARVLLIDEAIKHAWRDCVALMTTEQLSLFLFDRNDILWQLICMHDPISLEEIAEALKLSPSALEKLMYRLPCKSDRELADLMGIKEQRIHKLRNRMRPVLEKVQKRWGPVEEITQVTVSHRSRRVITSSSEET